jgi:hypothetical protein
MIYLGRLSWKLWGDRLHDCFSIAGRTFLPDAQAAEQMCSIDD